MFVYIFRFHEDAKNVASVEDEKNYVDFPPLMASFLVFMNEQLQNIRDNGVIIMVGIAGLAFN